VLGGRIAVVAIRHRAAYQFELDQSRLVTAVRHSQRGGRGRIGEIESDGIDAQSGGKRGAGRETQPGNKTRQDANLTRRPLRDCITAALLVSNCAHYAIGIATARRLPTGGNPTIDCKWLISTVAGAGYGAGADGVCPRRWCGLSSCITYS
jgi:hypothetical protein